MQPDDKYYEQLQEQQKQIAEANRYEAESAVKSIENVNDAAKQWLRPDLAVSQEVVKAAQDAAKSLADAQKANAQPDVIKTGDTVKASFTNPEDFRAQVSSSIPHNVARAPESQKITQEVVVGHSVRLGADDWKSFQTDAKAFKSTVENHSAGITQPAQGQPVAVAFQGPVGDTCKPVVVVPGENGKSPAIGVNAQPQISHEEERRREEQRRAAESKTHSASQQVGSPAKAFDSPVKMPSTASSGTAWGGDKIAESWSAHESQQKQLKDKIDNYEQKIIEQKARGVDTTEYEKNLKVTQTQYAINEHTQSAKSWSNTANFARQTQIGGVCDAQSLGKAESMLSYHKHQIEQLKQQQEQIKNGPEQTAQNQNGHEQAAQQQNSQAIAQAEGKGSIEQAQGQVTAHAQQTGQAPSQVQGAPVGGTDSSSGAQSSKESISAKQPVDQQQSKAKEQAADEYSPQSMVDATRERGRQIKQERLAKGEPDDMSSRDLKDQKDRSQALAQEHSQQQEKSQEKGKQKSL